MTRQRVPERNSRPSRTGVVICGVESAGDAIASYGIVPGWKRGRGRHGSIGEQAWHRGGAHRVVHRCVRLRPHRRCGGLRGRTRSRSCSGLDRRRQRRRSSRSGRSCHLLPRALPPRRHHSALVAPTDSDECGDLAKPAAPVFGTLGVSVAQRSGTPSQSLTSLAPSCASPSSGTSGT